MSSAPPNYLRRRHPPVKERWPSNGAHVNAQQFTNALELSMHQPSQPYGNRFDVLSAPPLPTRNRDYHNPPYYSRARYSRGSRESKRRRDARRNFRQQQAAQMLDEQLSRDINKTLSEAEVHRPPDHSLGNPTPVLSPASVSAPEPARASPTPPQLPYFNFGSLDLMGTEPRPDRSDLCTATPTSLPQTPILPNWCPNLPSFDLNKTRWGDFPMFFDLSKLPEPTEPFELEPKCKELQIWHPIKSPKPRKQSRFFPPPTPPAVELPATACKLHAIDKGSQDVQPAKPKTLAESVEQVVPRAETATEPKEDAQSEATAANLWRILAAPANQFYGDDNGLYQHNFAYKPRQEVYAAPDGMFDYRLTAAGMPVELDNMEVPFVHANSLTGVANERGSETLSASFGGGVPVTDSATAMHSIQEPPIGLNELVVDPYTQQSNADAMLPVLDTPPLPPSPKIEGVPAMEAPSRPPLVPTSPSDEDIIDIVTFLSTSHPLYCWCEECAEPPAFVTAESLKEDDGWMVYSAAGDASSAWEQEWGWLVGDDETGVARRPCSNRPEWDGVFPCTPSSLAHGAW